MKAAGSISAAMVVTGREDVLSDPSGAGSEEAKEPARNVFYVAGQALAPKTIQAGPLQSQYFECGNPTGTPLVLMHGFPDSPVAWQEVVKELDLAKYRVVLPYLRGYGGSTVLEPDYRGGQSAALAHDLLALVDALKIERFHLAGHDWGARTSYSVAVLAPQRLLSLTGLASPYLAYRGEPAPPVQARGYWYQYFFQVEAARKMLDEHRRDFCRELWRVWCPTWHFTDAEFAGAAAAWDHPQFVDIVLDYYRMRHGGALSRRAYAETQAKLDAKPLPTITVAALFIHGAADACDLAEGAQGQEAAFPAGYERLLLTNVGHFPHRENPAAVARALSQQLSAG